MAKQDFAVGLLQGLYQGGVGNPEVNDRRRALALEEAYTTQKMDALAADNGLKRDVHPETHNVIKSILFPGSGGGNPSYTPDPNALRGYADSSGEVKRLNPGEQMPSGGLGLNHKDYKEAILNKGKRSGIEEFQRAMALESRDREKTKFREDQISGFRDKLTGSQALKDYLQVKKYAGNIQDAVKNPGAFGDLTLLYGYMRAIEPDSVVREGDQRLFQAAGSLSQRTAAAFNRLVAGETLTQEQRNEVLKYTKSLKKNAFESYGTLRKGTYQQAERNQLPIKEIDPLHDEIVEDPFDVQDPPPTPTKVIGGKTYIKGADGWYEQ